LEQAIRTIAIEEFAAAYRRWLQWNNELVHIGSVYGEKSWELKFFLIAPTFVLFTLSRLNLNSPRISINYWYSLGIKLMPDSRGSSTCTCTGTTVSCAW
jgi:hypothetical protein